MRHRSHTADAQTICPWFFSDTMESRDNIRRKLSEAAIFFSPDIFVVGAFKEGLRQALADILIASESDQLFLTPFFLVL